MTPTPASFSSVVPKKIRVIGVPLDLGQSRRGVDMGPSAVRVAGLEARLEAIGHSVEDAGNVTVAIPEQKKEGAPSAKYLKEITATCAKSAELVLKTLESGKIPMVLGGDHSVAAGTVAGVAEYYRRQNQKVGLIWIDAHSDINTPETSPSGNVHGMPLAAIMGLGPADLANIYDFSPKVSPENCVLIGIRDVDSHEKVNIRKAGVEVFTMRDIDRLSRRVPVLCKVAPSVADVHVEDVHRAGGIMGILGELDRAGLIDTSVSTVHAPTMADALERWDVKRSKSETVRTFYRASPGGIPTQVAFSQERRYDELDLDREEGVVRDLEHAFSKDGGLAVLYGNLAQDGCIVKTAGVDASILKFAGAARVFESQDAAVEGILGGKVVAGEVVVISYEGPRGGPGMQEMLYPTSYLKSMGLGKACALVTDGRFSGGSSGLSIGHLSPEAAEGGNIGLVRDGDESSLNAQHAYWVL